MKALIDQIKFQKDMYLTGSLLMGVLYLLGIIFHDMIVFADDGFTATIYLGSMVALGGMVGCMFFVGGIYLTTMYNYAIAMGRTRKSFLPAYMAATFFNFLVFAVELKLLYLLEGLKLGLMYPTLERLNPIEAALQWKCLLAIALMGTALSVLIGALITKFGKAAWFVLWLAFMAVCIGVPRLLETFLGHLDNVFVKAVINLIGAFAKLGSAAVPVLIVAAAAILFGISYLLLRRQRVNL